MPPEDQSAIREKVERFNVFTQDNDPHGERDFGAFIHKGRRIFWKIDYYDPTMTEGSKDPAGPKTNRPGFDDHAGSGVLSMTREKQRFEMDWQGLVIEVLYCPSWSAVYEEILRL